MPDLSLLKTDKRTIIITGAFGSGKTECAMALSVQLAKAESVTLVDLDFVNPYFRSQDHREELVQSGVQVVSPELEVAPIDAPAMPPAARDAMLKPRGRTIVDLGGDPAGAIVIGQYAPYMTDYELWAVVNFARPMTCDVDRAAQLLKEIEAATRLQLTGLISNAYYGENTTTEDILDGLADTRKLGEKLGVSVVLLLAPVGVELPELSIPVVLIQRRLLRPWE